MSASRWALSVFLAWHIVSLSVRAVPPSDMLSSEDQANQRSQSGPFGQILDTAAAGLRAASRVIAANTGPLRETAGAYIAAIGIASQWRMFSHPPTVDQYVRLRYYVSRTAAPSQDSPGWMATELIVPAHPEDRIRLITGYRNSYADKAVMVALESFLRRRAATPIRTNPRPSDLPDDVAPVARFFARRFARDRLLGDERIVRTELWYGTAPNPMPASSVDTMTHDARLEALRPYYQGPVEDRIKLETYPPYRALEQEVDIMWVLEYFDE